MILAVEDASSFGLQGFSFILCAISFLSAANLTLLDLPRCFGDASTFSP